MRITLLGAHNLESTSTRLAGVLIDGLLALDAGSLTRSLTREEQHRVRHLFLTHRHYDHIRDVPALAIATQGAGTLHLYGLPDTLQAVTEHLLNGVVYPRYHERVASGQPVVALHPLEPGASFDVVGYRVMALPVRHTCSALGYAVAREGRSLFYTGDTGPGLEEVWRRVQPDLLLTEVTHASHGAAKALEDGHLTPATLRTELESLQKHGGVPRTVALHLNPAHEADIRSEMARLAEETGWPVEVGHEGMVLEL